MRTLINVTYPGTLEAFNVDSTVLGVTARGCFWQAAGTATTTGQLFSYQSPFNPNTGPLPPNFKLEPTSNAVRHTTT